MRDDAGFMTPTFGAIALALALIAVASLRLTQSEEVASRRDLERLQELYRADGVATAAAWRILHMEGVSAAGWNETTDREGMTVWVEPEARKLSLAEIGGARSQARLSSMLGAAEAARLTGALGDGEAPSRAVLREASDEPIWRRCGLSLVSGHSHLIDTGLEAASAAEGEFAPRAGEVWRIVVSAKSRLMVDRLVRFTGNMARPVVVLDELRGGPPADASCIDAFRRGDAA